MSEIKCPRCGEVFQIDESGYAALLKQVRDEEFASELHRQAEAQRQAAAADQRAALAEAEAAAQERIAEQERRVAALEAQAKAAEDAAALAQADLQARLQGELAAKEARIAELAAEAKGREQQAEAQRQLAVQQVEAQLKEKVAAAERERDALSARLAAEAERAEAAQKLAVAQAEAAAAEAHRALERERDDLAAQVERGQAEAERTEAAHQLELRSALQVKDEQIALREREIENMRHMRAELTVKMVGESLEQFCEDEFNKLRATGFQRARFGKDNDAADGSKGDYIYRELDDDGSEVVSIMFEMKNEAEDSTHRKRNEDHFKKLDHDRRAKGCEYAVLVSLLERDSDYYNTGIVDVSYESGFEKMYVIRPQFFIPLITLIRNAALRSVDYRRQLAEVRQQNVDVTNFEEMLGDFKQGFGRNCELASRKFQDAIRDIDATIKKLEKIKDELTSSDRNLQLANKKLDGLTVKRLTRKNPTMKAAFAEAAQRREEGGGAALAEGAAGADDSGDLLDDAEVLEAELLDG